MAETHSVRRRKWRFITLLILVAALIGGWSWLWQFAAGKAEATLEGWRAREAKAGRIYQCGSQAIAGYPFRIEIECASASALFRSNQPPVEIKTRGILVAAQIYQPNLLISEFQGPLTVAEPGKPPAIVVNWKLAQTSVRGTPNAPERVSIVLDRPVVDRMEGDKPQHVLVARHIELHGRIAEGSAANKPVIETVLRLEQASAPTVHPAAESPVDADITAVLWTASAGVILGALGIGVVLIG